MSQSGVGETLRQERVRRRLALDEISGATRISTRFLQFIEAEEFSSLPGLIFARNFVRQYAIFMELDPEPLLAQVPRFDLESAPLPQPPSRPRRSSWDPRWSAALASVAWTVLAGGAAVAAYVHFNHPTQQQVQAASPAPVKQAKVTAPDSTLVPTPVATVAATQTEQTLGGHAVQVLLAAKEESWVQAIADGKSVFTGMLKAGETRAIGADDHVRVRTGNAGGIEISLNGKAIDSLGPSGQIRSVTLTAEGPRLPSAVRAVQNPPAESSPI